MIPMNRIMVSIGSLGWNCPEILRSFLGGKEKAFGEMVATNFSPIFFKDSWTVRDIPKEFYVEKDGVMLMASGKIHTANEGCGNRDLPIHR